MLCCRDGEGTETWPNGDVYSGEWKQDNFNGIGVLKSGSSKYAGGFKDGKKEGYGCQVFNNGSFYEGEFKNNRMDGWGEYVLADDSRYEGSWKDGLKSGLGVMTMTAGEKFDGNWEKGKRHGDGIYRWNNGKTRQGEWAHDRLLQWTHAETFGASVHYHRGRPAHLKGKGNVAKIKQLREDALFKAASTRHQEVELSSGATKVQMRLRRGDSAVVKQAEGGKG